MKSMQIQIQEEVLQGELQTVFDALYDLGVIEPVLRMDWQKHLVEIEGGSVRHNLAVRTANLWMRDPKRLRAELGRLEPRALEYLAITVAREFADFHSRQTVVH